MRTRSADTTVGLASTIAAQELAAVERINGDLVIDEERQSLRLGHDRSRE
jgi:hypothetical protein